MLTYTESIARLKVEEEQRLSKKKVKENRQKKGKKQKCEAKKELLIDENICYVCKEEEPPCDSDEENDIDWVKCEQCQRWYHVECTENYGDPCVFC